MRSIDLVTAQNVVIRYSSAGVWQRILAYFIDLIVLIVYFFLMYYIFVFLFGSMVSGFFRNFDNPESLVNDLEFYSAIFMLATVPVLVFYSLFCEIFFNGKTLGKAALGIKVVRLDGNPPTMGDCFVRWAFRMVDVVFSLGSIAILTISASDKNQRLGDMMANTSVIQTKPIANISLADLLKLEKQESPITYPQVTRFDDYDMLLIKNALDRLSSNPNDSHKKVIIELSKKASDIIGLEKEPEKKLEFLKTLLRDYIQATR
ncbi:MAG: RDD family protein [Flavobacteriales bacterium]